MRTLKILLVAGSLLATLTSAHAADKSLTLAKADLTATNTLRERGLADDTAWRLVESLTTEVGPRSAGSPGEPADRGPTSVVSDSTSRQAVSSARPRSRSVFAAPRSAFANVRDLSAPWTEDRVASRLPAMSRNFKVRMVAWVYLGKWLPF